MHRLLLQSSCSAEKMISIIIKISIIIVLIAITYLENIIEALDLLVLEPHLNLHSHKFDLISTVALILIFHNI